MVVMKLAANAVFATGSITASAASSATSNISARVSRPDTSSGYHQRQQQGHAAPVLQASRVPNSSARHTQVSGGVSSLPRTSKQPGQRSARRSAVLTANPEQQLTQQQVGPLGISLLSTQQESISHEYQADARFPPLGPVNAASTSTQTLTDAAPTHTSTSTTANVSWSAQQLALEGVPQELHCLLDADAPVTLPAPGTYNTACLDNARLDRLVAALGRGRATWRRALVLYQWLKACNHELDDRLCTTLIRVCADHGDAVSALGVYEWMRAPSDAGGAGLQPTAYTYTATMRAALGVGMLDRAMQVWADSQAAGLTPDCRLCITYIEACTRLGLTDKALTMYYQMRDAPPGSPMKPSVHAYTAAMRAATEGGRWMRALGVWDDMRRSGTQPTGHAYAAAISACAAGADWARAVALFDDMTSRAGIRPDVVSCTALVTALASAGEADKAEAVVLWMHKSGLKPNVRTYTALLTALGNARQWTRAIRLLFTMQQPENGNVQPNAYTYSALIKALGEHGQWQLAEAIFDDLEVQVRSKRMAEASGASLAVASASNIAIATSPAAATERAAVAHRLLAVASAAEAVQQTNSLYGNALAIASGQIPDGIVSPEAAPAQVVQQMQLIDSNTVSAPPSSQTTPKARASASGKPEANPSTATASTTPHANSTVSDLTTIGSSRAHSPAPSNLSSAVSRPPSTPPFNYPTTSPNSNNSSYSLFGGNQDLNSVRNWSHPSQLNGIQLDLRSSANAAGSSQANSGMQPMYAGLDNGIAAGQYSYTSSMWPAADLATATVTESPQTMAAVGQHVIPVQQTESNSFSLFSSQPRHQHIDNQGSEPSGSNNKSNSSNSSGSTPTPLVNEVVCGAMMLAYERAGKWLEAVKVLSRARALGVQPNVVMFNMGISAAGKAGLLELAEQLFRNAPSRDIVTYEAMVIAYGVAGQPDKAEHVFDMIKSNRLRPREFVYCGLIAAHSMAGRTDAALAVRKRMKSDGVTATVHTYNSLLAACERGYRYEQALELLQKMKREGIEPNIVTHQLMASVGRHGVETVENQQVAAAALSAVFAAAGGLLIRAGMF